MESYLSSDSRELLNKIISDVKKSNEYIKCTNLKKEISNDSNLTNLIKEVKSLQKKYIRSNYDDEIKKELDEKINLLNSNKLFSEYNYYLEKVNVSIDLIKEKLNDYFYNLTNVKL